MRTIVVASAKRPPAIVRFLVSVPLVIAAYLLAGFVFGLMGFTPLGRALYASVLLVMLLWGFTTLLFWLDQVRSPLFAAAGLPFGGEALRDSSLGIVFGAGSVSAAVGVVALLGRVRLEYAGTHSAALLLSLWALVVAAMVEEVVFRGYPLHRLMEAVGAPAAVAATSCLFGLAHLRNPHASPWGALNTAEIGALLAVAYVRTRSLWLPWGIHFGWNVALGVGYGLVVSGYSEFSAAVVGSVQGPRWLTGGEYGIEASATATVVILVAIVVLVALVKPRPAPEIIVGGDEPPRINPGPDQIPLAGIQ
ncbi:MAG TPA: type II CAAX endopeptidase family protein [Terriglobales bacterium]|nr:type II CAAX endopeptidase family protein [Terriglobales bacterium]